MSAHTILAQVADSRFRRVVLVLVLALSLSVGASGTATGEPPDPRAAGFTATPLQPSETISVAKSASGRIARTDPSLLGAKGSAPVNVLIKYDFDSPGSYTGGVDGLAPTSPRRTGKKLKENKAPVAAYSNYIRRFATRTTDRLKSSVPGVAVRQTLTGAYGGVAARVPESSIASILDVEGVVAVQKDALRQPTAADEEIWTGATKVWPSLGGQGKAGDGVIVGVLDTGIWPEHPSFADPGDLAPAEPGPGPGGTYACDFGDGSDPALGDAFTCNNKLLGAHNDTATYMAVVGAGPTEFCNNSTQACSARDANGHGTHTSSTAVGRGLQHATILGTDRGPISGMAPGAKLIAYRVCAEAGCFNSDSVHAIGEAIADGVDVVNFSISGGSSPYTDPVELAFLDAFNAGISVNASAGNSGPGAGTANHGSPWVTTVGASTSNRFFTSTLHLTSSDGTSLDKDGVTVTAGIGSATPVVLASSLGDTRCLSPFAPGSVSGKVVVCERGTNARVAKGLNVRNGGAEGMILYNPTRMDVQTDNHHLPAIHLEGPNGDVLAFISGHPDVRATWASGVSSPTRGDVMAAFSSRGSGAQDFIKPDITAPGIQVLAGMTPQPSGSDGGPAGEYFQAIAGTSMSSPHLAGASALVKAAHPTWSPAMIKSALMTSSAQDVLKEDGVTPADPFDAGSGGLRVDKAVNPTLVFEESYADYLASAADPLGRVNLNLASIAATTMTGTQTVKRTATNVTGKTQDLTVSTQAPPGAKIVVSDKAPKPGKPIKPESKVQLKKSGDTDLWITIIGPELPDGLYFGQIRLSPKKGASSDVVLPVAFTKKQGTVSLSHACSPTTIQAKTGHSHCSATLANAGSEPANAQLTVTNLDKGKGLDFSNISAPARAIKKKDGVQWSGILSPALPPTVDSITPATGPAGGYLPLSTMGIGPIPGVGDETVTNVTTPTFYYGGEPYTRIGVVSNGYVVIGGGDSADVDYLPQTFPDSAPPNNVVAPLWTDLDPTAGGDVRIGLLTDGLNTWLVVDYDAVRNYGDANVHTFQMWFQVSGGVAGTGPVSEETTLTYGAANTTAPDFVGGSSGAENRVGSSGQNLTTPADHTEWAVDTSPPSAGGGVTVEYDASSKKAGSYRSLASMTSDVTPGTTQVVRTITVVK